ncbi:MAG TPA: XdhC family protein [Usitatibacter sp.]|nr:XdhC family protein [Usitatibacter sp.]
MTSRDLLEMMRELDARGEPHALVTVVRAIAPTSAHVGAQAIVLADGTLHGWIGGGCAKGVVIGAARKAIEAGEPRLVRISNDGMEEDGVEQHTMACASNGTIELFIQPYWARAALCVLGETPAAEEARFLAGRMGMRLADLADGAPVVLVATQGQGDEAALEAALRSPARQVLMIASRRKAQKLRESMRARGIGEAQLARLQAPAGPDAGAKSPAEIAMVAMVGVLAVLRSRVEPAAAVAKPQGTFVNPVCGAPIDMATAIHVETYEDTSYYFCCDGCWTMFRQDPAKYAAIHRASPAKA